MWCSVISQVVDVALGRSLSVWRCAGCPVARVFVVAYGRLGGCGWVWALFIGRVNFK